ncbi:unnamed protein product [Cunninghamella blakesleeana]
MNMNRIGRLFINNTVLRNPLIKYNSNHYLYAIRRVQYSSLRSTSQIGPRSTRRVIKQQYEKNKPAYQQVIHNEQQQNTIDNSNNNTATTTTLLQEPNPHFASNPSLVPVKIPQEPNAVITPDYIGAPVLSQPAIVVGRELEMLNVFLGYEQANKYKIMDPNGNPIGFIAEEEGFAKSLSRQFLRTHRRFNATILDANGNVIFKIMRPFSWINSRIFIYNVDDELVGEVQQRWHLLRRKYDLFTGTNQFATIDTPFLGWDFNLTDEDGKPIGNVSRNFVGFAREIFTDTGEYVLRMDAVEESKGLTLDQRTVMLACAVSIDFDYFSRHSSHSAGGGFMPIPFFGGGSYENEPKDNNDNQGSDNQGGSGGGEYTNDQQQPTQPRVNEYGDTWMSDEEAGVSTPDDHDWVDTLSEFFRPPE